jgi:hypothetical protein
LGGWATVSKAVQEADRQTGLCSRNRKDCHILRLGVLARKKLDPSKKGDKEQPGLLD